MIPKEAVDAAEKAWAEHEESGETRRRVLVRLMLEAAEEKWPHNALEKDITGSTNGSYERGWAPVHRFGFSKPTAC